MLLFQQNEKKIYICSTKNRYESIQTLNDESFANYSIEIFRNVL